MLGLKRSIEIKFESLPASEQPKMLAAMAKEWAKFQQLGATKPITHAEFQKAKKDGQKSTKSVRELVGEELVYTMTIDGMDDLKCVQKFKRI